MPIDTSFVRLLCGELNEALRGARVEKIFMPDRDDILLQLRGGAAGKARLLLSCNGNMPRVMLTGYALENPEQPPMLCMLLRKHLQGGRVLAVRQPAFDRVLAVEIEHANELGDMERRQLIAELIGRQSNLLLLDGEGRIIDAVRKTEFSEGKRTILPGVRYELPDAGGRMDPFAEREELHRRIADERRELRGDRLLMETAAGLSPLVAREICFRAVGQTDPLMSELDGAGRASIADQTARLFEEVEQGRGVPLLYTKEDGLPAELTFTPIAQYGDRLQERRMDSFSELVDTFYHEKDVAERSRQRSADIRKKVQNLIDRAARKMENQKKELAACGEKETLRVYGELLTANIGRIPRGAGFAEVENYYENMERVRIPLDVAKTPQQNAQNYFKKYQKARTAEKVLAEQIEKARAEIAYLGTVLDALTRAESERDIAEIREELATGGYMRSMQKKGRNQKPKPARGFAVFESSDGFVILAGHNNAQNDELSHRVAEKSDLWLHAQNMPGSHVVIVAEGREIPDATVTEAAVIAATMSAADTTDKIPVQYTPVKYLKKPAGAKPGFVTFSTYQTAFVKPDAALVERLRR